VCSHGMGADTAPGTRLQRPVSMDVVCQTALPGGSTAVLVSHLMDAALHAASLLQAAAAALSWPAAPVLVGVLCVRPALVGAGRPPGTTLDLKKSKHKKLSKFLQVPPRLPVRLYVWPL
jgi:hypothetical protein